MARRRSAERRRRAWGLSLRAELAAGREYSVVVRLDVRARGLDAESDFSSGLRGSTFGCLKVDSLLADTDGLYDRWEQEGIDIGGDGLDLDLPAAGADPLPASRFSSRWTT